MQRFLIITGPTAVGKTACAIAIAERLQGEIISADSRQVYRELTIGSAKPAEAELRRVRHHFIDELTLEEPFSAGIFADAAAERIREILERGHVPVIAGGSMLYLHALEHGLANIPSVDRTIRHALMERLSLEGTHQLFRELEQVDPRSARNMDPSKTQRMIRALEIYHGTGRPLSSFFDDHPEPPFQFKTIVLTRNREMLYRRINERVDQMLARGLMDEVRHIMVRGFSPSLNPLRTIGYQEPIQFLQKEIGYQEMVSSIKRNTRHYAKRQLTWFRRYPDVSWIDLETWNEPEALLDHILRLL